jgi:deoxycytidine triphosphate deaminase
VAGAIDGIGQIGHSPPSEEHRSLQLRLVNHSDVALERLRDLLGVGMMQERAGGDGYELVITKLADVQHILAQSLPYLVHKREAAYQALAELKATKSIVVDPKDFDANSFIDFKGEVCVIPPNSFALSRTVEYFRIPRTVLTICVGKSSYARCGIIVNVTPFEPEWEGFVTLEISNTTPLPAKIYANEGIAQVIFFEADEECNVSYADRKGKYQAQQTIVLPKL